MLRHCLWHGQIFCDLNGYTDLIKGEAGVGCNDRSSREIDSFAHKVTSETTFFALKALFDGSERLA